MHTVSAVYLSGIITVVAVFTFFETKTELPMQKPEKTDFSLNWFITEELKKATRVTPAQMSTCQSLDSS